MQQCAALMMDTIPMVMRAVGGEMFKHRSAELPMQQFRALMIIKHHKGTSLSTVAKLLGSSISSASKLIDGLVQRSFTTRQTCTDDRRRMTLALTEAGEEMLQSIHLEQLSYLAERLAPLPRGDCETIVKAMESLRSIFVPAGNERAEQSANEGGHSCP